MALRLRLPASLFGVAATMRTEALVYGAVGGAAALVVVVRRHWPARRLAAIAGSGAGGLLIALAANQVLERAVLGTTLHAGRAADTAVAGGANLGQRLDEAVTTLVGLNRFAPGLDWIIGLGAASAVMYGAWRSVRTDERERRLGAHVLVVAGVLYLARFAVGLGFVPGMLAASPLAATGIAIGACTRRAPTLVAVVALAALPLVWVFQYSGGANPQWGAATSSFPGRCLRFSPVLACRDPSRARTRDGDRGRRHGLRLAGSPPVTAVGDAMA